MIDIRPITLILAGVLCGAIWFAISQHPDIAGAIVLCALAVFTIATITAAILRGKK